MFTSSIRFKKEFRHLMWPWLAVLLAAIFSFLLSSPQRNVGPLDLSHLVEMAAFAGIPLLAVMVLGTEFQYRTLGLMFTQPTERSQIWRDKFIVMLAAVLPPAVLFCVSALTGHAGSGEGAVISAAWMLMTASSAFFWTLIARSTVGGLTLSVGSTGLIFMTIGFIMEYLRRQSGLSAPPLPFGAVAVLTYSIAMAWLGRRTFLDYQAIEAAPSLEIFETSLPGASFISERLFAWCRPRSSNLTFNLIAKELRLSRTIWPLTMLSVAAWIALVSFHTLPLSDARPLTLPFFALTVMLSILIALLAGSLSLGEEKQLGTHDWHLTLPVSATRLWLVKLPSAVALGMVCGSLLPMSVLLAAGGLNGNARAFVPNDVIWLWPLQMALISFVAFWSSCLLKRTVLSALFALPACGFCTAACFFGGAIADSFSNASQSIYEAILSFFGPISLNMWLIRHVAWGFYRPDPIFVLVMLLVGVAMIQSLHLFSASERPGIRILFPLGRPLLISLSAGFVFIWFLNFSNYAYKGQRLVVREVNAAIQRLNLDPAKGAVPVRLSGSELEKAIPLSPAAHRWVQDANIIVVPQPTRNAWGQFGDFETDKNSSMQPYVAVLRLNEHSTCQLSLYKGKQFQIISGSCD